MWTLYFWPVVSSIFFLSIFFSWPNFSRHRLDVCHTCTHDVALVANLECRTEMARWKYRTKRSRKIRHLGAIAQFCLAISLQLRYVSAVGKKLAKHQYLLHMSPQHGELLPTSGWDQSGSLGHPTNFNGFHVLAALLHDTPVVGVSQTLPRWTEGATYIRQGGHHAWHWPTF